MTSLEIVTEEYMARKLQEGALQNGSGGGTSGGMEARVAKLEAHMEHVRSDISKLADVPADLATLKERITHLPSKGFIVTATVGAIGAATALMAFLQHLGILH